MTTVDDLNLASNITPARTGEVSISGTTGSARSSDDLPREGSSFDIESVAEWVEIEQSRLKEQHIQRSNPVRVVDDTIRIDESAMLYDTVYPVKLSDDTTYHVIFTSTGAIEIYEVAP